MASPPTPPLHLPSACCATRPVRPAAREEGRALEPAATPPSPVRHNLPSQLSRFVGREHEIGEVKRLLDMARLVTLSGSGGVGKTRLALQVASELVDRCADGAWLVELAPLSDPLLVPQAVASALGVREEPGRSLIETLGDSLRGKELLLVLDNCEHLVLACARLAETLLRLCPKLRILASSREALRITGEVAFRVPSLATPDPAQAGQMQAAQLTQFESVRLFIDRAAAVMPRASP